MPWPGCIASLSVAWQRHTMRVESSRPSTSMDVKAMCQRVARNLSGARPAGSAEEGDEADRGSRGG